MENSYGSKNNSEGDSKEVIGNSLDCNSSDTSETLKEESISDVVNIKKTNNLEAGQAVDDFKTEMYIADTSKEKDELYGASGYEVDRLDKNISKARKKMDLFSLIRVICFMGFVTFAFLFINEVWIQPMRANEVIDKTRDLYRIPTTAPTVTASATPPSITAGPSLSIPTKDLNRDEQGRLLQFKQLLEANPDTRGWIVFPGTNINYAVVQRKGDPDYYLTHDFYMDKQKAGCIFMDQYSSVEANTKNLVIHGHNMKSTDNMFHHLEDLLDLDFIKEHSVFNFDTLYQKGQWKILSIFMTNGSDKKEPFFNYMQSTFKDSSEFLNFIYKLRIRSIYNLDQVNINENDQICTLSTCYKRRMDNYRLVIVARKVREGEGDSLDSGLITKVDNPLYPQSYYGTYGGEVPDLPSTFEEALDLGFINWYNKK